MTLYDVYKKPSDIKKSVWEHWEKWATENGYNQIGIRSFNSHFFTIRMIKVTDDKIIVMDIYPTRIERTETNFKTLEKVTFKNYKI